MSLAQSYALATKLTGEAITEVSVENDRARAAYMVARAAILEVRNIHGPARASELAYQLADEAATNWGEV